MKRLLIILIVMSSVAFATVTNQSVSVTFSCSGSTGPYPFTFPIIDSSSLTVTQGGVVLSSSTYTVTAVNGNFVNGGSVTLNAACNSPSTLILTRVTPVTQTTVYTDNMPTPMKTFERSLDKLTEISIEQKANITSLGNWACPIGTISVGFTALAPICGTLTPGSYTWESPGTIGSATPNTGAFTVVTASNFNSRIQAPSATYATINAAVTALAGGAGIVEVNAATSVSATISLSSYQTVRCNGGVAITSTANAPVFTANGTTFAKVEGCDIVVNTTGSSAGCMKFANTAGPSTNNHFRNNRCWQVSTPGSPNSGQYAVLMTATTGANAMYWNHVDNNQFNSWDRSIEVSGTDASNVVNDNYFTNNTSHAANVHMEVLKFANENHVNGWSCSTSGGPASNTCVVVGNGSDPVSQNKFRDVVGDQGISGKTYTFTAASVGNSLEGVESNGVVSTDAGTANSASVLGSSNIRTQFPSLIVSTWAGQSASYPYVKNTILLGANSNLPHGSLWGDVVSNLQSVDLCTNNYTTDNGTTYVVPASTYGSLCLGMRSSTVDANSVIAFRYRAAGAAAGAGSNVATISNAGKGTFSGGLDAGTAGIANTGAVTGLASIAGAAVSASANHAVCWKTATTLGYCSDTVGAGGTCTCN